MREVTTAVNFVAHAHHDTEEVRKKSKDLRATEKKKLEEEHWHAHERGPQDMFYCYS